MLGESHIALLSPATWDDRNDAYCLEQYRAKSNLGSVLAVCLAACGETYHHWRVFAHGPSGVCIEFDKQGLLDSFAGLGGFSHGLVDYEYIDTLKKNKPDLSKLPFLKRKAFKDEVEYRIIFESATKNLTVKTVPIDLKSITSVIFSPWLPSAMEKAVKTAVESIPGRDHIKLSSSRLIDNARWKKVVS
jgi:hypothetical protein